MNAIVANAIRAKAVARNAQTLTDDEIIQLLPKLKTLKAKITAAYNKYKAAEAEWKNASNELRNFVVLGEQENWKRTQQFIKKYGLKIEDFITLGGYR